MKPKFDLRMNSRGIVDAMSEGFFEKTRELVYGSSTPFPTDEYVEVELPRCIYRVHKRDIDTRPFVKFIERAKKHQTDTN